MKIAKMTESPNAVVLKKAEALINARQAMHERNVARICRVLCGTLGVDVEMTELLCYAAELHDIGKLASRGDYDLTSMREHTRLGCEVLTGTGLLELSIAASVALNHHERYDGSGYPSGLKGLEIPLSSRIIAICDVYDGLRLGYGDRAACPHRTALEILAAGDGRTKPTHFEPRLLEAFISIGDVVSEARDSCDDIDLEKDTEGRKCRSDDETQQVISNLSKRELEVLKLVALGLSNKEIARNLVVGVRSVETYRLRASQKLGLRTRADAVRYAIGAGWLLNAGSPAAEVPHGAGGVSGRNRS